MMIMMRVLMMIMMTMMRVMIMSACEAFSADHSVDKSAWDSVDSKGLYGRLRFPLLMSYFSQD